MIRTLALLAFLPVAIAAAAENLTVLPERIDDVAPQDMMHAHLIREVHKALDRRDAEYEKLTTAEQLAAHQQRMREFFVAALGGFRVQGRGASQAKEIIDDAKALEKAGAFCILLEMVPDRVTKIITERAEDCLIMSLGSGPDAHGQLLIFHDMFGLYPKFTPKMAKVYGNAGAVILEGLQAYVSEVRGREFPQPENYFRMKDAEYEELLELLAGDPSP